MTPREATGLLKHRARELGFEHCGVCPASSPAGVERLGEWLSRGYAGEMRYLAEHREAYAHPGAVLEGVRSLVMLATHYSPVLQGRPGTGEGRVARYAAGSCDYHDVIRDRLHKVADFLRELCPQATTRGVVDTAPLMEREFAQLAGLGWVGKNTLLLRKGAGSYFFLAAVLTDVALEYDTPHSADHCGTCTACLDACPTGAFVEPYVLDARRCISYLTIEHKTAVPVELRSGIGDWLFGCDVCQEVCPWNRDAPPTDEKGFEPIDSLSPVELLPLFDLDEAGFRKRFRFTPLWRPHRRGLLRNAAVVLGNQRPEGCEAALGRGLRDAEPLVRGACAWALGRVGTSTAREELRRRKAIETDTYVLQEIRGALDPA